jgi:transcriptional regulator with XRE-family HTH domain
MFLNLGPTLRLLRESRGLSQAELARRAGLGKSQVSKYEKGKEVPKLGSLERLLRVLDCRQDAFFATLALLDTALSREPGRSLELAFPASGALAPASLHEAFEASLSSLLALQRAVFEALSAGAAREQPPRRRQRRLPPLAEAPGHGKREEASPGS